MRLARSANVVSTDLGNGLALLDLTSNTYFSLNDVGAFLWSQMDTPMSRNDLVDAVVREYEVTPELCSADVDQLLGELKEAALVIVDQQHAE
ncbi:MAG: PqqD family protein [Hyphomicrobiales bacterium]|nr:MAG: PqqD family protein [Hyphomicrobiales bacterium]